MENPTNICILCNRPLDKEEESDITRTGNATSVETGRAVDTKKDQESPSISILNGLIKQNRNADFKSIVSSVNQTHLITIGGNTMLHTAAERSNIDILGFLIISGFDINAQNSLEQTPLHLALINNNLQAAQLLLSLDADILVNDNLGISTLQMCLLEGVPEYVSVCFLERLKRSGLTAQQMADHLENVGCSIYRTLAINDAVVTGLMLDRRISISMDESRVLLECAVNANYPENVKALLKHGPGIRERRKIFFDRVAKNQNEPRMKYYFERLVSWDVITEDFLHHAGYTFECENEESIQTYLDIGIDDYAREKFGIELLVALFYNEDVDAIKIVKTRQFYVNGQDENGYTALHHAIYEENRARVIYLLENGADPNIKCCHGTTPIFSCQDDETIELLLEAGADIQIISKEGESVITENFNERFIANLAILKERGLLKRKVEKTIRKPKNDDSDVPEVFSDHLRDLKWMKTRKISESVTLFTVLVDKIEDIARYVTTEDDSAFILGESYKRELQPIYDSMLTKNVDRALEFHKLRPKAAEFLCNVMKINQRDHLVIEKIVSFFTYRDLLVFDKLNFEY